MGDKTVLRSATPQDMEKILNVIEKAFQIEKGSEKWKDKKNLILREVENWRILLENGRIIGAVHIGKSWLKIGKSKILKGDVGEVSILPEYQGKGYGSKLMENTIRWMKKEKYDISRLGGLVKFYSRFGYIRFPRRYVEFSVGNKIWVGASKIEEGEIPIPEEFVSKIRPFNPKRDFSSYIEIHNRFNQSYTGASIINQDFKLSQKSASISVVFEENGKISGYLFATQHPAEYSKTDSSVGEITIVDVGYEKEKPYVFESLIKYINNFAYRKGIKRITARIPFDPEIIEILSGIGIHFQCSETYGGKGANMLQIINLQSLFERLVPELEDRLKNSITSNWQGILEIKIKKDRVQLHIIQGKIKVVEDKEPTLSLSLKEIYLLKLVLGLLSFEEVKNILEEKIKLNSLEIALLNNLFPRKLVSSSNWG